MGRAVVVVPSGAPTAQPAADEPSGRLLDELQSFLGELRGHEAPAPSLDDDLVQALGIDSLARMELMLRLERAFDLRLPESAMQAARTPRDLLRVLAAGTPRAAAEARPAPAPIARQAMRVLALPTQAHSLVDVLAWHAERAPQRCHVHLLHADAEAQEGAQLTYADLLQRARAMAGALQAEGVAPGDAVALMLPTGFSFLACFMGVLLAGGVPVPIYPPFRPDAIEEHLRRQAHILGNAGAVLLVSGSQALPAARLLRLGAPALRRVMTPAQLLARSRAPAPVGLGAQDTALVQYTSGSTGQPKGVVLSHANLLANIRAMGQALKATDEDVFVSWLPLYHDMGLIGAWLGSLYHGLTLVLMPPQAFLGRPSRWLRAISDHAATLTAAPNFAYEVVATRVPDDELQGVDLRRLRAALNGAEPVHAATLELFCNRFASHGFDRRALMPVYGLAECGVGLAFPPLGRGPKIDAIDRAALHDRAQAVPVAAGQPGALRVVGCGLPLPGHEIRVVGHDGRELPDRHEGRVEFSGPSATSGYLRNPEATRQLRRDGWLDTGDVGYMVDGEIHLTSRAKDLIKRGGHNLHPYDLEQAVGALPGVRRGCVAVLGATDPRSGSERVVVVAESRVTAPEFQAVLRERIGDLAVDLLGVAADDIVLAPPHAVLKTSSGKIRRAACRELYEQGRLGQGGSAGMAWQLARLWLQALARRLRHVGQDMPALLFAARAWSVFGACSLAGGVTALLPGRARRKRWARGVARLGLRAAGLAPRVQGNAGPHAAEGGVFVANHASYLDWLVLTAVLPADACFVAKRELARHALLRWLLARVGVRFVERDDVQASVEDARKLAEAVKAGERLVYFPEGTLSRAPGVQPFRMGAFAAAAESGATVVPVGVHGTRSALRDGSWRPRHMPIEVRLGAPLKAQASGWAPSLQLRDEARLAVCRLCGEAPTG